MYKIDRRGEGAGSKNRILGRTQIKLSINTRLTDLGKFVF